MFLFSYINIIDLFFSKFGQEYIVGQQHLYEDPCDEWLDLVNNKLTSPNFPMGYDPLTECKWNLTAPQGHYVTLDFEIIDVSNYFFIHTTICCSQIVVPEPFFENSRLILIQFVCDIFIFFSLTLMMMVIM